MDSDAQQRTARSPVWPGQRARLVLMAVTWHVLRPVAGYLRMSSAHTESESTGNSSLRHHAGIAHLYYCERWHRDVLRTAQCFA